MMSGSKAKPLQDSYAAEEDEKGSSFHRPLSAPPTSTLCLSPAFPAKATLSLTGDTSSESKAVSMASTDSCSALSFPAEASPAKPAVACTFEGTTSPMTCASDGPTSTETSVISISNSSSWSSASALKSFGDFNSEKDFPPVITINGVTVTLENNSVWKQFSSCGTEMILTKQGRRMFPYCRYRLSGLDPNKMYMLVLSIVPSTKYRYRWNSSQWEVSGPGEHLIQGTIRAFSHHYSPCLGLEWMNSLVSFYKLKLTNNFQDQDGHIILHSMHRYIPKLHIVPLPNGALPEKDQPVQMGPESITFTFPQTEFMAVTTYQNFRITQLKINHNPFAKGFRDEWKNGRVKETFLEPSAVVNIDTQQADVRPAEHSEDEEEETDVSSVSQSDPVPLPTPQPTRLVLKPIMSNPSANGEPYVSCIRGRLSLGELVLVQTPTKDKPNEDSVAPETDTEQKETEKLVQKRQAPSRVRRKKKRINRHWGNPKGKNYKPNPAPPAVPCSPLLQPELDDIDGLLFVSFISKEALEVHVGNESRRIPSPEPPVSSTPVQPEQTSNPEDICIFKETVEESISRLELVLLEELRSLKHRQIIHPVLQEVGLKLSSLDPSLSVDLQYLGICLPLPSAKLPEQSSRTSPSPGDEGLPFISRTGKTSDVTKIKGWKNKFIRRGSSQTSSCEGLPKNLSAFCSDMLDEYLENEEQQISERAAAFSTGAEASVSYQLPARSASYVKTLDSVLKSRIAASRLSAGGSRPCPLSYKLPHTSTPSSTPSAARPTSPCQAEVQSRSKPAIAGSDPGGVSQSSSANTTAGSQGPPLSFSQIQAMFHKPSGLTKVQLKLLEIEMEALNRGLSRTQLTAERATVALSAMLTKQMQPKEVLKGANPPETQPVGPECGKDFCRLGCVCSSLQHLSRGPLHCRRPDCMFGCACFKRRITKQSLVLEREEQSRPVYSVTNMEHSHQPRPGCHSQKLWHRHASDRDPEPLFVPRGAPSDPGSSRMVNRVFSRPPEIREEDKDPVYKYLESKLTCARVRELNSKPPPVMSLESSLLSAASTPNHHGGVPQHGSAIVTRKDDERSSKDGGEAKARKQIQIQSECEWKNDCTMVLEGLCDRMNQNRLNQPFYIGPYYISPITKILMRKPSGTIVTYRIRISKPVNSTRSDEESDQSDEDPSFIGDLKEDHEGSSTLYGVTPFMSGVTAAGYLMAKKKTTGSRGNGLVKVNGKQYNHARLLLGYMGALHPVNRLAAYVTGRVSSSGKFDPRTDTALAVVHQTAEQKMNAQTSACSATSAPVIKPEVWNKAFTNSPWCSSPMTPSPVPSSAPVQPGSRSSPVSLTVSPSLKSPSFLAQRGTYSFRICPPSNLLGEGKKQRGLTLPGGFTLIQLPKPGEQEGAPGLGSRNAASHLAKECLGVGSDKVMDLSRLICDEKRLSEEESRRSLEDMESVEDFSSDFSDSGEDYDELIDIETVEEEHEKTILMMKEAALKTLLELQDYSLSIRECYKQTRASSPASDQEENNASKNNMKRKIHTKLERLRRYEQRALFEKLKTVLNSHPHTSKSHLLSLAAKEIRLLEKNTKTLEEKKQKLIQIQSEYIRKLSRLSGLSEMLFHNKLQEMSNGHQIENKVEFKAFFSKLLQPFLVKPPHLKVQSQRSQARIFPAQSKTAPQTGLQPSLSIRSPKNNPGKDNAPAPPPPKIPPPFPPPAPAPEQTHQDISAAPPQGAPLVLYENQTLPGMFWTNTTMDQTQAPPDITEAQISGPSFSTEPKQYSLIRPSQPPTPFPLIRSKNGRIILPSSMKMAVGQAYYTLMVIQPNMNMGEADSSYSTVPSSDPVRSNGLEDVDPPNPALNDHAACSDPDLSSVRQVPLTDTSRPSPGQADTDGGTGAAQLSFNSLLPDQRKHVGGDSRRRGRPKKHKFSSDDRGGDALHLSETSTETLPTDMTPPFASPIDLHCIPSKRGRGRPPKTKSSLCRGSVRRASESRAKMDSSVRIRTPKSSDPAGLSRPLTRGSMGKDFPSAKKRSWEDIEKELDPDLDLDLDIEFE